MSYEYKNAIKSELKHFHENMLPVGSWKYEQKLNELNEVYAKAKSFDEIMKVFENQFGFKDVLAKDKIFIEVQNAYIESEASE